MQNSEKEILNIIKYLPVALIFLVSSLLTFFLYNENLERFDKENKELEATYISLNKDLIKFQVEKIKDRILQEKKSTISNLKKELKTQVTNAHNIAMSIYTHNKNKSQEEVTTLIKDALRDIRFNNQRGYLFLYEREGKSVLHPLKPFLENKNLWNYQDKKGTYLLQEMYKILETKNDTFYTWYWTKREDKVKEYEKIGYFKKFEPFDWFIGTGEYIYDFDNELQLKLAQEISDFRYKEDGYIFVLDFDGNYLSYHNKSLIGKNVFDLKIAVNTKEIQNEMIALSSNGGGFVSYNHKDKPITNEEISKVSYVTGIKDWNWIVGTGFYMDDFYKELKDKKNKLAIENNQALEKLLIISFFVTVVVLILFIYIASILEEKFFQYKESIEKQINDNIKKDNILTHQSKMAAMGEMIGNIAHQWRQPLSTISTIVTGIKVQKDMGIKDEILEKESLEKINKHVQYLSQTIDDFRNFFKPDKDAKEFELSHAINKTLELVEAQVESKDIKFVKNIENTKIFSLENELIQVLINLINNARDELVEKKGEKYIFISSEIKKKKVIISIKDNAGGVREDIINRIFEPYFTTKQMHQGTGIGLFMSEEIVVKHLKGKIIIENKEYEYESKSYKGACFKIIFPKYVNKTKEKLSSI